MARKIGIINKKGGVLKSTSTAHLGHGLALMGHKVLIIDSDTQGQAGLFFDVKAEKVLTDYINGSPKEDVIVNMRDNLDLLASDRTVSTINTLISMERINPQNFLKRKLKELDNEYDFIIVDGSPGFNELSVNILFYVDELIIPVSLQTLAVDGLASFIDEINEMEEVSETRIPYRILPTLLDGRVKQSADLLEDLKKYFDSIMLEPIRYYGKLAKCPEYGQTIYEFEPNSRGAEDYVKLVEAI